MSGTLKAAFARAQAEGRPALVAYVMAGDPSIEATRALVPKLVEAGADVIELGLPFSDPIADGPVLQAAATRALAGGASVAKVVELAASLRGLSAPIVLMGYVNPILSYGEERFAEDAANAGVAGAIIPDLPADEAESFAKLLRAKGLAYVPLVAPTTPVERIARIAKLADGFVYYVSVTGVTGARAELPADLPARVAAAREAVKPAPLAVGFGISNAEQARSVGALADGVVVGSAIVKTFQASGPEATAALVRSLRGGLGAR